MEVSLSQYAGFCDGVKRAFDMVMIIDMDKVKKPIYILGSLAHNQEVVDKIEKKGIKRIDRDFFINSQPGEIGTIVITAHGTGPDIFKIAEQKGIKVIDTTCPKVIKVQRLAMVYVKRGYKIIIVGDKDHKEVRGIDDWGDRNAFIISEMKEIDDIPYGQDDKIAILSQTTQNEDFYNQVSEVITQKFKNALACPTTCHTTHSRQGEVKKLAKDNDVVIVIGDKASANSRRLFEIAEELNFSSFFIEKTEDINPEWLVGAKKVGVTAGASTPEWVIDGVVDFLRKS